MIGWIQLVLWALLAFGAMQTVRTREPLLQAVAISFYGLVLAALFFLNDAPDVALSQITAGAVALPLMILLALTRIRRETGRRDRARA